MGTVSKKMGGQEGLFQIGVSKSVKVTKWGGGGGGGGGGGLNSTLTRVLGHGDRSPGDNKGKRGNERVTGIDMGIGEPS